VAGAYENEAGFCYSCGARRCTAALSLCRLLSCPSHSVTLCAFQGTGGCASRGGHFARPPAPTKRTAALTIQREVFPKRMTATLPALFGIVAVLYSLFVAFRPAIKLWLARLLVTRSRKHRYSVAELEEKHVDQTLALRMLFLWLLSLPCCPKRFLSQPMTRVSFGLWMRRATP
jgi:hypothetical protein